MYPPQNNQLNADKLKMFAWDNEDVEVLHLRQVGPDQARGAEAPSRSFRRERREARAGAKREPRVAAPRLGAPRPTMPFCVALNPSVH